MATRTLTAMFSTRAEAERAAQALVSELHLDRAMIRTSPEGEAAATTTTAADTYEDKGFFASLKDLFLPEEDRYVYAEGVRRGSVLLTVQVDENQVDRASDVLEREGAADLEAQEAEWRQSGWTGYDATRATAQAGTTNTTGTAMGARVTGTASAPMRAGQDETLKVVEESLRIGKREVERGSVRVRSYIVETPVEEQVTLRDETVHIERRPVDRAATEADKAAFRDMTIEARETDEEAVVSKEARVVEEIGLRKESTDHVETVSDTVRKTKVDIEDTTGNRGGMTGARTGTASGVSATGRDGTPGNPPGTMASRAVDKTLDTNISGANPGGGMGAGTRGMAGTDAPDGTPGNPPGTMASRAVDKALDTNISGANPGADAPDGTPGNPKGTMASRGLDKTLGTNTSGTNPGRK